MWFRWPVHADLYVTQCELRLIGRQHTHRVAAQENWQAAVASLAKAQPRVNQVTLWLGAGLVRYGVLAPVQGKLSQRDVHALVHAELQAQQDSAPLALKSVNSVVPQWQIASLEPDAAGRRVWSAINTTFLSQLRTVLGSARIRVNGIAPVLTRINQVSAPAKQSGLLLLMEAGELIALQRDTDGVASIRQIDANSTSLAAVLERLQMQTGVSIQEMQVIDLRYLGTPSQTAAEDLPAQDWADVTAKLISAVWLRKATA